MKRIESVQACVCGAMPVLHVRNCGTGRQEYGAQCPICGIGSETGVRKTNWSAYSALKEWNDMQRGVKRWAGDPHV